MQSQILASRGHDDGGSGSARPRSVRGRTTLGQSRGLNAGPAEGVALPDSHTEGRDFGRLDARTLKAFVSTTSLPNLDIPKIPICPVGRFEPWLKSGMPCTNSTSRPERWHMTNRLKSPTIA